MIKVGSDFSGVGAFDQALIRLKLKHKTVFACDLDRYARQTYIENYGEPHYYPENVYERKIPKQSLDIYMTSPPCQSFSIAGKRGGEKDERGVLFYNSHEFIIKNRPRFFIFENVKGLLSDDGGKTFQRWIDFLAKSVNGNPMIFPHEDSAGYHVYHAVLNSKDYGVPQNRERVFVIGIRDDKDNNFRFPKPQHLTKRIKDILEDEVNDKYFIDPKKIINYNHNDRGEFKPLKIDGISRTIRYKGNTTPTNKHNWDIIEVPLWIGDYRTDEGLRIRKDGNSRCLKARISSETDPSTMSPLTNYRKKIRRLTPRECFRLQGFPDTFKMPCSDSQMYKQAGNSITVGVLEAIIKNINI